MNLSFAIGALACLLALVFGIIFGGDFSNVTRFFDLPSLFITVGGTLCALIASFPFRTLLSVFKHYKIIFGLQKHDPMYYIEELIVISQEARKKGLLSMEDSAKRIDDPFMRDAMLLVVDAVEPEKVRERLESEMNNIEARHAACWDIYDKGAALAPGFGMIGTLIGLVNMLSDMNFEEEGGATRMTRSMATALVTTFYGSIMANVIFIPAATQLRSAHNKEMLCKEIVVEGILSIQIGENPRHLREKLLGFLSEKERDLDVDGTAAE